MAARFNSAVFSSSRTLHTNCSTFYLPRKDGSQSGARLLRGIKIIIIIIASRDDDGG